MSVVAVVVVVVGAPGLKLNQPLPLGWAAATLHPLYDQHPCRPPTIATHLKKTSPPTHLLTRASPSFIPPHSTCPLILFSSLIPLICSYHLPHHTNTSLIPPYPLMIPTFSLFPTTHTTPSSSHSLQMTTHTTSPLIPVGCPYHSLFSHSCHLPSHTTRSLMAPTDWSDELFLMGKLVDQ